MRKHISVGGSIPLVRDGNELVVSHQDPCPVLVLVLSAQ